MIKQTCKFCGGTVTISSDVALWQCRFCMKKNKVNIPKEETVEIKETFNIFDSQEIYDE